jgi:hypothetical protein
VSAEVVDIASALRRRVEREMEQEQDPEEVFWLGVKAIAEGDYAPDQSDIALRVLAGAILKLRRNAV